MARNTKTLGPWFKGLNLTSNRDLSVFLGQEELGQADNVILTLQGFIEPRPGCKSINTSIYSSLLPDSKISLLGKVQTPDGASVVLVEVYTPSLNSIVVYKVIDPTIPPTVYFMVGDARVNLNGTLVPYHFTHVTVHKGISTYPGHEGVYFFGSQSGSTYHTSDFTLNSLPTLLTSKGSEYNGLIIPGSDGGLIVKDRLFLWNSKTSVFYWSNALFIANFSGNDNPGLNGKSDAGNLAVEPTTEADGITSVSFLNNNFYIFKRSKSFMFTYQSSPTTDGYFRKFNGELGAFDSTIYRNNIVVINGKGVFKINSTDFVDLQRSLNLRFEIPIDRPNIDVNDVFISAFNNDILVGFYDRTENIKHYYCMNGYNGGWTRWNYNYFTNIKIASPGSNAYISQSTHSDDQYLIYTNFEGNRINYTAWKPSKNNWKYHLDGTETSPESTVFYAPNVVIKTNAAFGDSMLNFKKLYKAYLRFYLSEVHYDSVDFPTGLWTLSINYNKFFFNTDPLLGPINPIYEFYPAGDGQRPQSDDPNTTHVFSGIHQIPIHQQRVKEFVFELIRKPSVVSKGPLYNPDLNNPAVEDRLIKQGYYFMLSSVWFEYEDKVRV